MNTVEGIPIISMKTFFSSNNSAEKEQLVCRVRQACETVGCFCIVDHGVDWNLVKNCFSDMCDFFHLPLSEKVKYKSQNSNDDVGYIPFKTQNINAFMGRDGFPNDPMETFSFSSINPILNGLASAERNVYPNEPRHFKTNIESYYAAMKRLTEQMMQVFSCALSMPEDFIYSHACNTHHQLKAHFYPKASPENQGQDRFAEHTDGTPFTILCTDGSKNSLMVRNGNGEWIYANPPNDAFFINLGDCLAFWTNEKWKATPHKVVFPVRDGDIDERYSLVFFVHLNHDAILQAIPSCAEGNEVASKYEPKVYKDYVISKMSNLIKADGSSTSY